MATFFKNGKWKNKMSKYRIYSHNEPEDGGTSGAARLVFCFGLVVVRVVYLGCLPGSPAMRTLLVPDMLLPVSATCPPRLLP